MKRSVVLFGLSLLSLILVLGCGKAEEPAKAPKTATAVRLLAFQCAGGQGFTVELDEKGDSALLKMNGQNIQLAHVPSGSGAKYSDGKTTLWMKGKEAMVEVDGKIIMKDCQLKK